MRGERFVQRGSRNRAVSVGGPELIEQGVEKAKTREARSKSGQDAALRPSVGSDGESRSPVFRFLKPRSKSGSDDEGPRVGRASVRAPLPELSRASLSGGEGKCLLLLLPDELLLSRLLPRLAVADLASVLFVCKRLSHLAMLVVAPFVRQENRLAALNDVRRLQLFVEQLSACRGMEHGVAVEDYDAHPVWRVERSRFRLILCPGETGAGRLGVPSQLGELRLLHGRFWYRCILVTTDAKKLMVSARLTRAQARSVLAAVVAKTRGDHVVAFARLERDRWKLPDPIFRNSANDATENNDDSDPDTLELDERVHVDVKMGV
jgi:hypothetical protein